MTDILKILYNIKESKKADDLCITNISPVLETTTGVTVGYNFTAEFYKHSKIVFLVNIFDKIIYNQ